MPRPASTPSWSTNANYPAGADPWSATPTRVEPDPADKAAGFVPGTRPPAQWDNWLIGILADWTAYFASIIDANDEHTYPVAKARTSVAIPLWEGDASLSTGGVEWGRLASGVTLASFANGGSRLIPLRLPHGAVLNAARVVVKPGAARATIANRMGLNFTQYTNDFATPSVGTVLSPLAIDRDNGTINTQVLELTPIAHTIDSTKAYFLTVFAGNDGGAHVPDALYSIEIDFTDPGPRNY